MLLDYVAENWSSGVLGPESKVKDSERVGLLLGMVQSGINSKRIIGETTNMVVNGSITNVDFIC